jgi:transcriptional regulator with PAS, ATPase and Fis domain
MGKTCYGKILAEIFSHREKLKMTLQEIRDQAITIALARNNGNRVRAAKMLCISERTLRREISRRTNEDNK